MKILSLCMLGLSMNLHASEGILRAIADKIGRPDQVLELGLKEKQEKLAELEAEKAQLDGAKQTFIAEIDLKIADIEKKLAAIKEALKIESENEFLIKNQSYLNDWFQVLKEQQKMHEIMITHLNECIVQLSDYLKDPQFKTYEREQRGAGLVAQSFEYVQGLNQKIVDLKKNIEVLAGQDKDAAAEYENKKRYLAGVEENYKKKKEELIGLHVADEITDPFGLSARQKAELLMVEEKLLNEKVSLEKLRLKDIKNKRTCISVAGTIAKAKMDVLKNILAKEKSSIKVTELDIVVAREDLAKRKQQVDSEISLLQKDIDQFDTKDLVRQEVSKRYGITLSSDLDEWRVEPGKNVDSYASLFEVGLINDQALLANREKDLLEARKNFEQEQFAQEALQVDIQESYYRIASRKFKTEVDIAAEIKKYSGMRDETMAKISEYTSRRKTFAAMADAQRKALEILHNRERELKRLKDTLFKNNQASHNRIVDLIHSIQTLVKRQIKVLEEIIGVYDDILSKINTKQLQLNFIVDEFNTIRWYRSEYAVTIKDLRTISTDIGRFGRDVSAYIAHVHPKALLASLYAGFDSATSWLFFLIKIILLLTAAFALRFYLPRMAQGFLIVGRSYRGLRILSLLFACVASFFTYYFSWIIPWVVLYAIGQFSNIPDPYIYALFYVLSIPYVLFLAHKFVHHLVEFNQSHNYVLISNEFQNRFALIFKILLYATISIFLFREAFLSINYLKSELPTILLAVNVIILQIALIFLLGKEQILNMIPTQTAIGEWVYKQVDTYYNLILLCVVTLIILSNPYVGFGRYILRVVMRIAATIVLTQALIIAHNFLKRTSAAFFFNMKEDAVKERFSYAKTWYGVFVIVTMITFIALALIIGAKLWHWPEALAKISKWDDIKSWLTTPILMEGSDHPLSVFSILQVITFIFGGLLIAFIFDKFVLNRIFDVLLVEHGVQNAVSSLTRYCIIIAAFIFGIQSVGLGAQVSYFLAALLLGVGWVIKDPAYDFISYFIILIQRPVKIGDYIKFDDDVRGVVRRITPRSVVLRRRNSATVIVPNSHIMSKSFSNWNYSRGFIAFDDIFVTIEYAHDPLEVKSVLVDVLSASIYVLKSPAPLVRLYRFGAYGFIFQVRGFLSSSYTLDMWDIASDIRMNIAVALRKKGINIAHIKSADSFVNSVQGGSQSPAEFPDQRLSDE